jgi:S1-C subfamily serine protease
MLKEFLSSKSIAYQDHDVNNDSTAAQEMVRLTGQNGVPVTVIDGQTVVGFDQAQLEGLIAQTQAKAGLPPKFGAAVADVGQAARKGVPINFGAYVGRIKPGSIAEKAGFAVGDVIIQLNNQAISSAADLEHFMMDLRQGDRLSIVFMRGNAVSTSEVTT